MTRIAVVHPGTQWSTSDVYDGLCYGLEAHGVDVVRVLPLWALKEPVDAAIMVTAIRQPWVIHSLKSNGMPVVALFTESPYEQDKELDIARQVQGCWTHERTAVATFKAVNEHVAYLPHAWHPAVHTPVPQPGDDQVPAHDVVFVGSGFRERVSFFNSIDWTGIDLGLYGIWDGLGLKPQVAKCLRGGTIPNTQAAALYRKAKIGLNLYRRLRTDLKPDRPENWVTAESLNPRAYELAACRTLQISEWRAELRPMFPVGSVVWFKSTEFAEIAIRSWLENHNADSRISNAWQSQNCVNGHSWTDRAGQVLQDLHAWGLVPCLIAQ